MPRALKASEAQFLFEASGVELGVVDFNAEERISSPFTVDLTLAAEAEIDFESVLGQEALLTIAGATTDRYFHGLLSRLVYTGTRGRYHVYRARLVPTLWFLSLEQDCRIFQDKSVVDIVKQILTEGNIPSDRIDLRLQQQYQPREYCVQYRETDLEFVSRLLEEEGIFYFFEHAEDKHLLVLADGPTAYKPIAGEDSLPFNQAEGMLPEEESVFRFSVSQSVFSGKFTQRDYNFERPSLDLTCQDQASSHSAQEIYDYPGRYLEQKRGADLAKIRLQELMARIELAEGESVCPRFLPGYTFELSGHDSLDLNREYFLTGVVHSGSQPEALQEAREVGAASEYRNRFQAVPSSVTFRPERRTPRPVIRGVQTAVVVGPSGEEIYTDKYARVKVHFHWDREGKFDEKASCWMRVSQVCAGAGWGAIDIPRIGHEVVVDFLEGDPDRPMITGRVYHATNQPPTGLPSAGMVSGMKSNTTPGGGGYNEITMDDTKGKEKMTIHAQYDMNTTVEHDQTNTVNNTFTETIKSDAAITVTEGKYNHDVAAGTADYHVKGALTEKYDATQATTVKGDITVKSTGGAINVLSDSALIKIDAATKITLHTGASTIEMDAGGNIKIDGVNVSINGSASVAIKGAMINSEAQAQHQTKGAIVLSEGSATNTIKGGMVMLNP